MQENEMWKGQLGAVGFECDIGVLKRMDEFYKFQIIGVQMTSC